MSSLDWTRPGMSQASEAEAAAPAVREGERGWPEAEFAAVFREHYARVVAAAARLTGERAQAEEIADDAFWKLYRRPHLRRAEHNVGGWLYRTATRMALDALRARKRRRDGAERLAAEPARDGMGPLGALEERERAARVRRALGRLRPAQAQILALRISGLSYEEVAAALRMKATSVGTTLARAEAAFAKEYEAVSH
jgi:RNA polymerase sigma-70 factor (ECF subfamily)